MDLPCESGTQRTGSQQPDVGLWVNIQRIIPDVGEQPGPEIKERTIVESLAPAENGDVVEVPVLVAEQHVRFEQQGQVDAKPLQASEPNGLFGHPAHLAGKVGLAGHCCLPVGAYPLAKKVSKGQDTLVWLQKVGAGAAVADPPVDLKPLHPVGDVPEPQRLHIGLPQQGGDDCLGQPLVPEQVQLVPAALFPPFFLIALRRGLRDAVPGGQLDRHHQPSKILIQK